MLFNKLVSGSRHLFRRGALPLGRVGEGARGCQCHVVAVPPRNKISSGEKMVLGAILIASVWATPFWVLYHIPDYQKEDRNKYTGK